MNKEAFLKMRVEDRVQEVNKLLQEHSLTEIAELLDIPSSTFSKIMREGDYLYHQGHKKFYAFIRNDSDRKRGKKTDSFDEDELYFIRENIHILRNVVESSKIASAQLILDERIYGSDSVYVNKNLRMNKAIYEEFVAFCGQHYPGLTIQHLCSQALLDFICKYTKAGKSD